MKRKSGDFRCSILRQPVGRRTLFKSLAFTAGGIAVGLAPGCKPAYEETALVDPVVKTSCGSIRGYLNQGIYTFRGVRYGASTAGPNRFMPPKPPEPWTEIRDASGYGYRAPQTNPAAAGGAAPESELTRILWASDGYRVAPAESEDCLFLNIWTPTLDPAEKRPVMVWLHGGGFSSGSSSDLLYDGTNLARRGAVMVGVNHRLNVFGYTHLGDIGGEEYAHSGNAGQLDIIAALEWVRDNIGQFGGDPGRVMIFGESGGGAKVSMLLASPPAKGLFHAAVIESGPGIKVGEREPATRAAELLLDELGIKARNLKEIHTLPTSRILSAYFAANARMAGEGGGAFRPVLDPVVLPAHPFYPAAPTVSENVPVMVGWNKTESTAFSLGQDELWSLDEEGMRSRIEKLAGADTDRLIGLYRKEYPDMSPSAVYFHIASYPRMGSGSVAIAERKAALGKAPAYLYRLDWETPVLGGKLISPHGLEMPFVFDNVDGGGVALTGGGAEARKMAGALSETWIAFAATGNPNTPKSGLPPWDPYDAEKRPTMIFDTESRVEFDPLKEQRLIFEEPA
ncbi:MAG: carboxylesterase/lipase family protein [Acidobacteria bacterium]|nr:carboxylesterase/lipase family protein [Acidobacteriota bacterium]